MIDHVDHIVLTTRDLAGCIRFYGGSDEFIECRQTTQLNGLCP